MMAKGITSERGMRSAYSAAVRSPVFVLVANTTANRATGMAVRASSMADPSAPAAPAGRWPASANSPTMTR